MRAIWAICAAPPPSCLGWALGAAPYPCVVRAGRQLGTPHASSQATPAPKPHQFPAELAQEAVKPSAVHALAGAPARPASSSSNSSASGAERAPRAGQRRTGPPPGSAAPSWPQLPPPPPPQHLAAAPRPWCGSQWGRGGATSAPPLGPAEWVGEPFAGSPLLSCSGGRGGAVAGSRAGPAWDSPTPWAVRCVTQDKAIPRGSLRFPVFPGIGLQSLPQRLRESADPPATPTCGQSAPNRRT